LTWSSDGRNEEESVKNLSGESRDMLRIVENKLIFVSETNDICFKRPMI